MASNSLVLNAVGVPLHPYMASVQDRGALPHQPHPQDALEPPSVCFKPLTPAHWINVPLCDSSFPRVK